MIAGSAKGARLAGVPAGTRPVSDRAREGLFSSLGPSVTGARVLDLYAGTGALGIEALSRGAAEAVFVDAAAAAVRVVRENLERTGLASRATVLRRDARRAVAGGELGAFELVLLDPPYATPEADLDGLLDELAGQGAVTAGGTVALTRPSRGYTPVIPLHWQPTRRLVYGDSAVLVFRSP